MQHDGAIECLTPPVRSRVWRGLGLLLPVMASGLSINGSVANPRRKSDESETHNRCSTRSTDLLYLICFVAVSAALLPLPSEQSAPEQAGKVLAALLAVSFLNTVVLAYVILRSRWGGWKLILAIFLSSTA